MKLWIAVMFAAFVLFFGCTATQQKMCDKTETYTVLEPYNETVPYVTNECRDTTVSGEVGKTCKNVTKFESYLEDSCVKRNLKYVGYTEDAKSSCRQGNVFNCDRGTVNCRYSLLNYDTMGGNWTVEMTIRYPEKMKVLSMGNKSITVAPSASAVLDFSYEFQTATDLSPWVCEAKVTVPVTEECTQNEKIRSVVAEECTPVIGNVTKNVCQDVTKYREEQKERQVEKTRTIKAPC